MYVTFSDPAVRIAWISTLLAAGLSLVALFCIAWLRWRLQQNTRREQDFVTRWQTIMLEALLLPAAPAEGFALPPLPVNEQIFFLRLLLKITGSVRGSAQTALPALCAQIGCPDFARRILQSGDRPEQLLAILALGQLNIAAAWPQLEQAVHHPDALHSFIALQAMIRIDSEKATQFCPLLLRREEWALNNLASLLQSVQQSFTPALQTGLQDAMQALQAAPGDIHIQKLVLRALQLLRALRAQPEAAVLLQLLEIRGQPDLLTHTLKLCQQPQLTPAVRQLCRHADWQVRVQAVRSMAYLATEEDLPLLEELLQDSSWWVRYRSAQSLLALPFFDATAWLAQAHQADRYARDILQQVLMEREHGILG